ncbi:MAG: T9SS type A sorting domain-containing protein [Bacteroidales bacterium]|nr:T9SS type A sorting domain-containing protein [Bacteroidales bacterium]
MKTQNNITEYIIVIIFIIASITSSQAAHPIIIDGLFDDWAEVPLAVSDPAGDNNIEDFAELKITNDNDFLFLNFSFFNNEYLLQDWNEIRLYIDTDNNPQTGLSINGIGAELEWCFGCRNGCYHAMSGNDSIYQNNITLRQAPTITSGQFEVAISRNCNMMTLNGIQIPDTISLFFIESNNSGDMLPDNSGGIQYVFDTSYIAPPEAISLSRHNEDDIRIVTYNTLYSGLLDVERQPCFERIFKALEPDIVAFQEQDNIAYVNSLFSSWFPDITWYASSLCRNNLFVISKYPVLQDDILINSERMQAVLLETEEDLSSDFLVINSHLACCSNNSSRQEDSDEFIKQMREFSTGDGLFPLDNGTPFVNVGDFNLVGYNQQLKTLIDGDIYNEFTYGEDFPPDWDGTSLTDLFSRHTHIRMAYTWRNNMSFFSPGKLDYVLYSNSVIDIGNHFVLNTLAMPDSVLLSYGLQADDTQIASDHLPRVIDIAGIHSVMIDEDKKLILPDDFKIYPAFPNPFDSITKISYDIPNSTKIILIIYNTAGQEIRTLVNETQSAGNKSVFWDGKDNSGQIVSPGVYTYCIIIDDKIQSRKLLYFKN